MQGDDQYYENVGGTRFVRKSRQVFPRTSWGSMGIKVFDVNNDGRLDIFVTDMHSDMSQPTPPERDKLKSEMKWPVSFRGTGKTSIWGNSLFVNDGPGKYHEASDAFGLENYCPWGPSVGDLNADGFDDVFIAAGMNYPERYMINSVKLNDRGQRFADAEFALGVEPRSGGIATPFFELDASGKDKGHKDARGRERPHRHLGRARLQVSGDLRRRRRRRSRRRHQRVQRRADGAHQQPDGEDPGALPGRALDRDGVEPQRARRHRQGHRRRRDIRQGDGRQHRLSLAWRLPAVFRPRFGGQRRQHRGHVAERQEADGADAGQDEFGDRGSGA